MTTAAPDISAAVFPAILEGPEWLRDHPAVRARTLAYACEAKADPFEDRAKWGRRAAEHYRSLPVDAVKAMEPTWICTQLDVGRKLSTGELVGGTADAWIRGLIAGRFDLGRDVELLNEAVDPCRDTFLAGDGPKFIIPNVEPRTDMHEGSDQTKELWARAYREPGFLRRIAKLHPEAVECGPSTWGEVRRLNIARVTGNRLFHQAKVNTIRAILNGVGLLVPGVTVAPSFCWFASPGAYAVGVSDDPMPPLTAPRDKGVRWAGNCQRYRRDWSEVTRSALFRLASRGLVIPTIWPVEANTSAAMMAVGCEGAVIIYIDEDMRARDEGRADKDGNSMLSRDQRKSSERWMADEAARLVREYRESLR